MPLDLAQLTIALADRYALERELGAGGMATVYLAQDLRHQRRVAIKVLRPELAAVIGAQRFLSEITTTANLQHPHILPLHDSGEVDGTVFYVMPYVEGESLRDRLAREKQLPVAETVRLATEVAGALDYAHRHGVIHRDIKPENILLHDGQALVADFGIALAATSAGERMTETGMSLGTPHYMSPEQAMGERDLDARSDVYALGCVLYEMLVGEPPFTGPTAQAIVAKVMTVPPAPVTQARPAVPPHVADAVAVALEKLPADRFPTPRAFADALTGQAGTSTTTRHRVAAPTPRTWKGWLRDWRSVAALAGLAGLAGALAMGGRGTGRDATTMRRDLIAFPDSAPAQGGVVGRTMALTADGQTLVYMSTVRGRGQLVVKDPGSVEVRVLPGTDDARWPEVSPDGQSVLFVRGVFLTGSLEVVPLAGGPSRMLVPDSVRIGAAWGADGSIYYTRVNTIYRLPPGGGTPEALISAPEGADIASPVPTRGGLVVLVRNPPQGQSGTFALANGTQELRFVTSGQPIAVVPPGILVVAPVDAPGPTQAMPFDDRRLEVRGPAITFREALAAAGVAIPDLVATPSVLLYRRAQGGVSTVAWVTREGVARDLDPDWSTPSASGPALSPDGRRLAVSVDQRIVIKQLPDGPATQLLPPGLSGRALRPAWHPGGHQVVFYYQHGRDSLLVIRDDGLGTPVVPADDPRGVAEAVWSPDGRWLVYRTSFEGVNGADILATRTDGTGEPVPLVHSPAQESTPQLSPDGRWLAYTSDESGQMEVYVRPFPNVADHRWQASVRGGMQPRWSRDGREMFYISLDGAMVAAALAPGTAFGITERRDLFSIAPYWLSSSTSAFQPDYDVSADGQHFVLVRTPPTRQLIREVNWLAGHPELTR